LYQMGLGHIVTDDIHHLGDEIEAEFPPLLNDLTSMENSTIPSSRGRDMLSVF
jgi:hypothetical protein